MTNDTPPPKAWLLTRHKHRDFDECFYFTLDEAMQDAEIDSEDLPEGQFRHRPRPLYEEESLAELDAQRAEVKQLRAEIELIRNHHDACVKELYKILGITDYDGEFRFKWVALEMAKLVNAYKHLHKTLMGMNAHTCKECGCPHEACRKNPGNIQILSAADQALNIDTSLRNECEMPNCCGNGVPGNENIIDGKIMCDYCHIKFLNEKK